MGEFIAVVVIILVLMFVIEHPILTVFIIAGIIALIILSVYLSKKKDKKKASQYAVGLAVEYIEAGYELAKEHARGGFSLWMWPYEDGFQVEVHTDEEYKFRKELLDLFPDAYSPWELVEDDGRANYVLSSTYGIGCTWKTFVHIIWETIKEKHPDWKVEKPQNDRIYINLWFIKKDI